MMLLFGAIAVPARSAIPTCGFLFFTGAAVYRLVIWLQARNGALALAAGTLAVLGSIALATLFAITGRNQFRIIMFLCIPSILFAAAALDLNIRAVPRRLRWIGDITYATYLIHFPIIITYLIVANARGLPYALPDRGWFLVLYIGVVITVSLPIFHYFEIPVQDRLREIYRHRSGLRKGQMEPAGSDPAGEII
jgi:peptidoglycan/LPS O-acetylase OafA/YrhL